MPKPSVFPMQRFAPRATPASRGRVHWAQVSASLGWDVLAAQEASPASPRRPALQGPPSPERKENYITQQASRGPLSFQVFARGRRGGRGLDVTLLHSLSLCQSRDIFFSFLYSLPPTRPSLPHSLPSLPPSPVGSVCALGRPSPTAAGTRGTRGRSRLSRASSLSLPLPCPLPPPPTRAWSGSQRNPEVSIPPFAPLF